MEGDFVWGYAIKIQQSIWKPLLQKIEKLVYLVSEWNVMEIFALSTLTIRWLSMNQFVACMCMCCIWNSKRLLLCRKILLVTSINSFCMRKPISDTYFPILGLRINLDDPNNIGTKSNKTIHISQNTFIHLSDTCSLKQVIARNYFSRFIQATSSFVRDC